MRRFFMFFFSLAAICNASNGQESYNLTGIVYDEVGETLVGATVLLNSYKKGTITNYEGKYNINNITAGSYVIEISFVGYITLIDTIKVAKNINYNAHLKVNTLRLNEVVIRDDYAANRKKEESLSVEVVNDDYLKRNLGGSLMNSLERLPGVTSIDIGSGQSKPVIRGLGFNRVVVVENNVKHEAQQWGADHGLEIDQYAIDNIEVIKGPASLMYGSDAIGGVIKMKNRKTPSKNTFGGSVDLTGKTNNNMLGTSVALYGRKNWFFADVRATILDYGDYKVPTDSVDIYSYRAPLNNNYLRNTAGNENNLHASFGIIQRHFQSKFYISNVSSKNGFFANAHGLEPRSVDTNLHDASNRDIQYPYQTTNHLKIINSSKYDVNRLRLEFDLGFQRNFRQEWSQYVNHGYMPPVFPDTLNFDPDLERQFIKLVYSAGLNMQYQLSNQNKINVGLNGQHQQNDIDGRGFIIPTYKQTTAGAYALAKHSFSERSTLQLGIRYDYGRLKTTEYYDWFQSPVVDENNDTTWHYLQRAENLERVFSNLSWSVGYNYNSDKWMYKVNIGKSFRMPIAKELAANGVNYHRFSYEVGDADLSPEISYQFDVGIEYNSRRFAIGTTPFLNYFTNYIYLNPSWEHDRLYGNGNQIYYYTQSKVFRFGGELHAHYELIQDLQIGVIGEYVYSEQLSGEKKGFTLPFSPPPSGIINLKYQQQRLGFIEEAYLTADYRITAPQNNIVPPEESTPGYQVINLGAGGSIRINNQVISVSMQIQNLLNNKYFNHTSYYRLINVPEAGRNFIVNISIPFFGKLKQK